jgi:cell division protein FtsB
LAVSSDPVEGRPVDKTPVRIAITGRVIALVCVLLLVVLFYAPTVRIFLDQQHQIALAEQEIRDRTEEIARLQGELERWDDPAYVRAQARNRLGWVVPGETGYRVVGADGKPLGGGVTVDDGVVEDSGLPGATWWAKLWGSVEAADKPAVKARR